MKVLPPEHNYCNDANSLPNIAFEMLAQSVLIRSDLRRAVSWPVTVGGAGERDGIQQGRSERGAAGPHRVSLGKIPRSKAQEASPEAGQLGEAWFEKKKMVDGFCVIFFGSRKNGDADCRGRNFAQSATFSTFLDIKSISFPRRTR